ncbi:MAG: ATP-binding protein [Deltaproteobacteria bacterium]|nr:ATP-binding protein [Deltaproteobacteria bacterium]
MNPDPFEQLGALYLGRPIAEPTQPLLLPSRHLVTHGVIVGMTGSGKTGLGAVLLEELAIDGVPAIAIDPKGDLGNLLLTFPQLDAASFAPWVPPGEDPQAVATRHANGLAEWGQDGARVARFASSVERVLYTPGSSMGRALSLLPSLGVPPAGTDVEVLRERALATTSGLLTLVGVDPDPVKSPEHSLVSTILMHAWTSGQGHDLVSLLRAIQSPPFASLGAMDVETVVPSKARAALAVQLNNAFASPSMAGFLSGEPLEVQRLLYTAEGKPKLSILSLAHLSDADRMFFVTVLLGEVLAWMRAQSGTNSLRALLYMDEVFGYFPPVANPPSKLAMLTLLKQARAFGLGVVLATQNPVDLDYKGLSNAGTWMLGRLQTERDKLRVLDGLESAASASGQGMDRAQIDAMLSGLAPRTFLLHSVHERAPRLMQSRWALSYLRGPLSRDEMKRLATPSVTSAAPHAPAPPTHPQPLPLAGGVPSPLAASRPVLPPGLRERFFVRADLPQPREYRPGLLCTASLHYAEAKSSIDSWLTPTLLAPLTDDGPDWQNAWFLGTTEPSVIDQPHESARFAALPAGASRPQSYKTWEKAAVAHFVRDRPLVLPSIAELGLVGKVGESRDAFLARATHALHEGRDDELEKLASKWQPKIDKVKDKLERSKRRLAEVSADGTTTMLTSGVEIGATVLGAMFGSRRRSVSAGVARAARSARSAARGSASKEAAEADVKACEEELSRLETSVKAALDEIRATWKPENLAIVDKSLTAKKSEIRIERLELCWVPVA